MREVPVYIEKEVIKYEERDVFQDVSVLLLDFKLFVQEFIKFEPCPPACWLVMVCILFFS